MDELNNLIRQTDDPYKRSILKKLKPLCLEAHIHMYRHGGSWKQKYRAMWKTDFWKEARTLLKAYFTENGVLTCEVCSKPIKDNFTLHHKDFYGKPITFFHPDFCSLIHNHCHVKTHFRRKQ